MQPDPKPRSAGSLVASKEGAKAGTRPSNSSGASWKAALRDIWSWELGGRHASATPRPWKLGLFGIGLFGQLLTTSWLFFLGLQLSSAPYTEHQLDIGVLFLAYGMNLLCFVLVAPAIRWGYYHAKK